MSAARQPPGKAGEGKQRRLESAVAALQLRYGDKAVRKAWKKALKSGVSYAVRADAHARTSADGELGWVFGTLELDVDGKVLPIRVLHVMMPADDAASGWSLVASHQVIAR